MATDSPTISPTQTRTNERPRRILVNIALLLASTALALLLSEAALRLFGWLPLYVSPERDRFWKHDALLGWAHQPGQEGVFETAQFRTAVRINQRGLRDREHSYERPGDVRRILVLGDSFAWGYGVEEPERFSQRLETLLGVEVINAGVSGYSTDQELLWLQTEGYKYDVDLVILVFSGNDIGDNQRPLVNTIYYKPQFALEQGQLVLTGYPAPRTDLQGRLVYSLSQRSALVYFLAQRYFDLLAVYRGLKGAASSAGAAPAASGRASEPFALTVALLEEIRSVADSKDARFMIVATDRWWNSPEGAVYSDFITTLRSEGFLVLDVEARPGFDPGAMLIPDDGHWNSAGHEFAAEEIQGFVAGHQLLGP